MCAARNEILNKVLHEYARFEAILYGNKNWKEMSENELWIELCLCILSSNVPYESAQSALFHLIEKGYLRLEWINETPDSENILANELSKPLYMPKRVDGSHRRYRFPNVRARNIFQAARVISSEEEWLSKLLKASKSEREVRDSLAISIPGLGLKEASHFLRNIRYSDRLAIIDSHVVSFLEELEDVPQTNTGTITRKSYLELESRLQKICDRNGLNVSVFDMAIWHYMRKR